MSNIEPEELVTDADELIEVLSRRHDILRSLLDTPKERHVLVDYLNDSKSTVYKGVSQLQELGLIESTSEGLQPTLFGIVALERYDELARTAGLGELLADLPPEAIAPSALVGAEAVLPDSRSVERHLIRGKTMLRNAESIRGFSPAISPEYVSLLHQRIVNDSVSVELVLTEEIATHLWQEYAAVVEDVLSAKNVTLYRTESELPFTLLLVSSTDSTEFCIELGEVGLATGLIINDITNGLRWAETVYEREKRTAERIS